MLIPEDPVDDKSVLVLAKVWHRTGDLLITWTSNDRVHWRIYASPRFSISMCYYRLINTYWIQQNIYAETERSSAWQPWLFTGDVGACLQRLQRTSGLSTWRHFRFSATISPPTRTFTESNFNSKTFTPSATIICHMRPYAHSAILLNIITRTSHGIMASQINDNYTIVLNSWFRLSPK